MGPDRFDVFAGYCRERLVEDPHLWATTLFDEVLELGYDRSYPTFTRQLRVRGLRPACEPCRPAKGRPVAVIEHPPGSTRAVNMRIGVWLPSERSTRHTANPSRLGIITSRMIVSNAPPRTRPTKPSSTHARAAWSAGRTPTATPAPARSSRSCPTGGSCSATAGNARRSAFHPARPLSRSTCTRPTTAYLAPAGPPRPERAHGGRPRRRVAPLPEPSASGQQATAASSCRIEASTSPAR
jgi:hypothetical protein